MVFWKDTEGKRPIFSNQENERIRRKTITTTKKEEPSSLKSTFNSWKEQ